MARVEMAPEILDDFDRVLDHLVAARALDGESRVQGIIDALQLLGHSPFIGRPVAGDKRELVIGKGARGFVALYRYVAGVDTVFVLAIRGQREAGYARDE